MKKRILALLLSFAMMFGSVNHIPVAAYAAAGDIVIGSEETVDLSTYGAVNYGTLETYTAYFADDNVQVYDNIYAEGYVQTMIGVSGIQIELMDQYILGDSFVVYEIDVSNNTEFTDDQKTTLSRFQYVAAEDITFTDPTPAPEATETPETETTETPDGSDEGGTDVEESDGIVLNFLPDGVTAESETSGETATINTSPVKLYKSLDNGAAGIEVTVESGTEIELITKYTFASENGNVVFYRFDYTGDNEALYNAALSENSGYPFIYAEDVTIRDYVPDTEAVIPETPTLTPGADVSIVDAYGIAITESGLRIKEGTKTSLSAWTGLEDNGDEVYQWQISSEETGGAWVNIQGQTAKGMLMSLAMVNTLKTTPYIRCKVTTGGTELYSQAIPVTALAEATLTDSNSDVSVAGLLPQDATLTVTPASLEETGLDNGAYPVGEASLFSDVTLYRAGSTYQPEEDETVTVTFPESSVTASGLSAGDGYHVYHIHDGVVDISGVQKYNGGDIAMTFDSLSVVGISEATQAAQSLVAEHGEMTPGYFDDYKVGTFNSNSVVLYETPDETDYLWMTTITGCSGAEVEFDTYYTYADGFVVYKIQATNNTPEELQTTLGYYAYVSADDITISDGETEEPEVINTCAICGKEMGVDCTTAHVYCAEHNEFDCTETHENAEPDRPLTEAEIPENVNFTPDADVSIADAEGNEVTGTFEMLEGTQASLSAWTTSDGTYQWQICDNDGNWQDIQGKTQQGLLFSPALFASVTNPVIRCEVTSGDEVKYSTEISVTIINSTANASLFSLARTASANNGIATVDDTPALGDYTVVINYVFENNVVVADPYTATLAAGSNFSATVKNPAVMGYLPYVNDATETAENVQLNITNIQADVTYTVTYKPTNVNYTVIHYWQNVDNDNYTIHETETLQGLTKSTVGEVAKDYPGMYALLYERPEIAADGSTVVEVYYDRNYYMMFFNLGEGGYGVDPVIYARFGAPVSVGTPTRPGYTFNGWAAEENGAEIGLPETVPVDGGRYWALWTAVDEAKVKVVIYGENPNDEEYSYLTTGEVLVKPGTEYTYNGTDQLYLYCDQEEHTHDGCKLTCGKTEHTQHTEECYGCEHTHSLTCYSSGSGYYNLLQATTKPDEITDYSANGIYTYITTTTGEYPWGGSYSYDTTHYYLYLDGTWYCAARENYRGEIKYSDTTEITSSCSHTHTDACLICEYHEHTDACYGCGKEVHTHDSSCTGTVEGMDSAKWTFVRSETVTVAADGSSVIKVYYDRVSYSVQFYSNSDCDDNKEYTSIRITAKWGANIVNEWPTYNGSSSWLIPGKNNTWQNGIQVMPIGGAKFWGPKTGNSSYTAYYYVEALPGATDTIEHNGVTYVLHHTDTSSSSGNVTIEEQYPIEGFTYKEGTEIGESYSNAKFYYTRHKYAIEFYNPTDWLKTETGVPYQAPLSSYDWTPDASMAPDKYEPGSVEFEGWYLDPECAGDRYDFTTHTMPVGTNDGDTTLTLYAKWVPVTRTVEFYLDKEDMENSTDMLARRETPHGSVLNPGVEQPENGDYTFVGWFYMDGDEEKGFVDTMPITKDMKVYAKWSSNVLKEYTVYFKIQGTDTQIADPITGSGLAGITKTFDAKGGTDLYVGYQEGYFPLVESHSMTIDIENDANNTYTFWYVQKDAVPYKVYYVAETLKEGEDAADYQTITRDGKTYYIIAETKEVNDNRKAVVTEKFKQVSGYMPDAYQKRLVVDGNDGAVNEIIFYYTVDSTHAYYKITHYTQNTDGENWTVYDERQFTGEIGQVYTADPLTIDGFTYDSTVTGTVTSGELTASGLELKLYYVRNSYPYEFRYLEQGSGKELAEPKTGTGLYGAVVSENAIAIENYTAVDPTSQTLTIKIEEDTTAKLNIITFYYTEQEVEIKYVAVGNGTVTDPSNTNTAGSSGSETLKVLSGTAQGSTATANTNYKFVGWFDNEACAGEPISTDAKYVPTKVDGKNVAATYYAKFELDVADLTITKTGTINTYDANQSFIFRVTGPNGFSLDVVINGTGSVTIKDLPIGTYTVTEITEWSWRYTPDGGAEKSITLGAGNNEVIFNNTRNGNIYWLAGDSFKENQFTVKPKDDEE